MSTRAVAWRAVGLGGPQLPRLSLDECGVFLVELADGPEDLSLAG